MSITTENALLLTLLAVGGLVLLCSWIGTLAYKFERRLNNKCSTQKRI
jgi:hypothetical protein